LKKRIIAAVAVFGLLGGILYFAYAQTAAQNNVKHFTAFFAVEGESIDQNNDIKIE
jgi:putative aldouronate transport system substrate-binding protein